MSFINLGKIDTNLIPLLLGCIFSVLTRLLYICVDANLYKHFVLTNILSAFSKTLTFVPYIKTKICSEKIYSSDIQNINKDKYQLIHTDIKSEIASGKISIMILSAIIYFIQGIIYSYTIKVQANTWIWDILITSLLYYWLFKVKLYKHHYVSMILIILIGLIIDLAFENLQNDVKKNLLLLFLRILRQILLASTDVINKYL